MNKFEKFAMILLVIAGLLWGLVGLFNFDLIDYLLEPCWFTSLIYAIFGVAGLYMILVWIKYKTAK